MKDHTENDNRILRKLRSESGASISFALLLFLVCAALSAVILVAATTSAGRMSNIAEADQQYYAVTSAAGFLVDLLDDQTVSVITFSGDDYSGTRTFHKAMSQITDNDISSAYNTSLPYAEKDEPDIEQTSDGVYDSTKYTLAEDTAYYYSKAAHGAGRDLTLTSEQENDAMSVNIEEKINKTDGTVLFTISKSDEKNSRNKYKMQLVFSVEDMPKAPPVTQVEFYNDLDDVDEDDKETPTVKRKVSSSHEITLHLKSMATSYDVNPRPVTNTGQTTNEGQTANEGQTGGTDNP